MFRSALVTAGLVVCLSTLGATTLIRATLDDLIQKSTEIVRGRVERSYSINQGSQITTHVQVRVLERWKGPGADSVEFVLPGGESGGFRQQIIGVPQLTTGSEHIFFLWAGSSGTKHMLGLSQGVLDIAKDKAGNSMVSRRAVDAVLLDPRTGKTSSDESVSMSFADFSARVSRVLKGTK